MSLQKLQPNEREIHSFRVDQELKSAAIYCSRKRNLKLVPWIILAMEEKADRDMDEFQSENHEVEPHPSVLGK